MTSNEMDRMGMMRGRMKGCKLCAFVPVTFGVILFLSGYFLDAETVRLLWLALTGFISLMGIMMLIMLNAFNE